MPKPTTSRQLTVGIGAVICDEAVLFVRRKAPEILEYDHKLELPGGKIEMGEALESGIEREVLEETGVKVVCKEILPFSYTKTFRTKSGEVHIIVLCARCIPVSPILSADSQTVSNSHPKPECEWIPIRSIHFDKVIPGSKEFLLWCLKDCYAGSLPKSATLYKMDLQLIDDNGNKLRKYQVVIEFYASSEVPFIVKRLWGRIGGREYSKTESFRRMDQAIQLAQQIVSRRRTHGYSLTAVDDNHPLRSWLAEAPLPIEQALLPKQPLLPLENLD